tara:strand:+ start:1656 stop:2168 length:513 start_codon:yes stop_codon:yes gene_type:complete
MANQKKSILIVEKDREVARAVKDWLEKGDYTCQILHSLQMAETWVLDSNMHHDLILLDHWQEKDLSHCDRISGKPATFGSQHLLQEIASAGIPVISIADDSQVKRKFHGHNKVMGYHQRGRLLELTTLDHTHPDAKEFFTRIDKAIEKAEHQASKKHARINDAESSERRR